MRNANKLNEGVMGFEVGCIRRGVQWIAGVDFAPSGEFFFGTRTGEGVDGNVFLKKPLDQRAPDDAAATGNKNINW